MLGLAAFLVYDIWDDLEKWVPLGGLAIFVIISVLCSENPSKVCDAYFNIAQRMNYFGAVIRIFFVL